MRRIRYLVAASLDGFIAGPQGEADWIPMDPDVDFAAMSPREHPDVTIVGDGARETLAALRAEPGKDIWLFGGGVLFRSLLDMGLVDSVEVAVVPVLLGGGIPLLPPPAAATKLQLTRHRVYPTSGLVSLEYAVT